MLLDETGLTLLFHFIFANKAYTPNLRPLGPFFLLERVNSQGMLSVKCRGGYMRMWRRLSVNVKLKNKVETSLPMD